MSGTLVPGTETVLVNYPACLAGDAEENAVAKVLFVVTGATYLVLKDGTRYAAGYRAEEFANPYRALTDAGHEVVVAAPAGTTPNVDMMSLRASEKVGIDFSRGPVREPYMVEDRNLITGQNPHSAAVLAERLLKLLA